MKRSDIIYDAQRASFKVHKSLVNSLYTSINSSDSSFVFISRILHRGVRMLKVSSSDNNFYYGNNVLVPVNDFNTIFSKIKVS